MTAHDTDHRRRVGSTRRSALSVIWGVVRRLVTWAAFTAAFVSVGLSVGVTVWAKVVNHRAYVVYVTSNSMKPTFEAGDILAVTPTPPADLAVGQIVTMKRQNGVLVTHRIIKINHATNGIVTVSTKGDANKVPDFDTATGDQILGTVHGRIPQLAQTLNWVQSGTGRIMLLAPIFVLFVVSELVNARRKGHHADEDETDTEVDAVEPAADDEQKRPRDYKPRHRR